MKYLGYWALFLVLISSIHALAQQQPNVTKPTKFKTKVEFKIDTRHSFVHNDPVNVYGLSIGLQVSKRSHFGIGLYTLSENSKRQFKTPNKIDNITKKGYEDIQLTYISAYYRYQFLTLGKFDFSVPLELGIGRSNTSILDSNGVLLRPPPDSKFKNLRNPYKAMFVPGQIGLSVDWRILKWLTLNSSLGYRFTLYSFNGSLSNSRKINYSGMYYDYGVSINFGYLYKALFKSPKKY